MNLYFKYLAMHFKSAMQYKTSFILLSIGQFFVPFSVFLSFSFLFRRFGNIQDFNFYEVAFIYSIANFSFAITESFVRGFDSFSKLIKSGDFDRLLVRPQNLIVQVLGSAIEFTRIGRIVQSILVFIIAVINLEILWNIGHIMFIILMIFSGFCVFSGIFILTATIPFWTVEGIEIANIFTDGGRELSQYPLSIYKDWFRRFFTYIIPFACVNFLPFLYLTGKSDNLFYAFAPIYGIIFVIPCISIWYFGVKKYKSTGS